MISKKLPILLLLAIILCFLMPCATAQAAGENTVEGETDYEIFLLTNTKFHGENKDGFFFLFSGARSDSSVSGDIYSFFGDIIIDSTFDGDIYSFFSKITLTENAELKGKIYTFSSEVLFNGDNRDLIVPLVSALSKVFEKNEDGSYSDEIPIILTQVTLGVAQFFLCLIIYASKKSFIEQGSVLLLHEPLHVINYGLFTYIFFASLIFIFILSVILFPVSFLFFIVMYILSMFGETSLAITIGYFVSANFKKWSSVSCLIAGLAIIECVKLIPYFSLPLMYLFLPILTLGTVIVSFVNGFMRRIFYTLPFDDPNTNKKKGFSKKQIRDMILKKH